jgi:predicted KAP-like P-loop ATPase
LDDRPFPPSDPDPLGMKDKAAGIASILEASIAHSPFILAMDAGWGMGKSTLLGQIEHCLPGPPKIAKLHFNASATCSTAAHGSLPASNPPDNMAMPLSLLHAAGAC